MAQSDQSENPFNVNLQANNKPSTALKPQAFTARPWTRLQI